MPLLLIPGGLFKYVLLEYITIPVRMESIDAESQSVLFGNETLKSANPNMKSPIKPMAKPNLCKLLISFLYEEACEIFSVFFMINES